MGDCWGVEQDHSHPSTVPSLPTAPLSLHRGRNWCWLAEDYVKKLQLARDKLFLKIARSGRAGQPLPPVAGCLHDICLVKGQIKELATTCHSLPVYLSQALAGSQAPASTFIFKYWPDLFPAITGSFCLWLGRDVPCGHCQPSPMEMQWERQRRVCLCPCRFRGSSLCSLLSRGKGKGN